MSFDPTQTRAAFDEEESRHYRAVLRTFVDIAMAEAESIHAEPAQSPGAPKPDRSIRLDRIARTIRRCILLARKLAEPLPIPRPTLARETTEPEVESEAEPEDALDSLETERLDRLDAPDREDDLARRPIHEIVAEIARDLGVATADPAHYKWQPATPADVQDPPRPLAAFAPTGSATMLLHRPPNKPDPRPPKR